MRENTDQKNSGYGHFSDSEVNLASSLKTTKKQSYFLQPSYKRLNCLLSKWDVVPRNTRWIYDWMTLFCIVSPQHIYHDWLKVIAKNLLRNTANKSIISKRLHIKSADQKDLSGIDWIYKQMRVEIYLRFHWSTIVAKIKEELLKKRSKSSRYQNMKKLTQG